MASRRARSSRRSRRAARTPDVEGGTLRPQKTALVVSVGVAGALATLTTLAAHDPITTRVTWNGEIARLFQARCVECHAPGLKDSIPLTSYEEARPWAKAIREEVLTRRMPIWRAARGYGDFSNDPSLSPFEIALIVAWADGGAPRGTDAAKGQLKTDTDQQDMPKQAQRPGREITLACKDQPLPQGRLLAVRPDLNEGGSVGIAVRQPDGSQDIVAWIRNYEARFATTYWLRTPVVIGPGSRLVAESSGRCSLTATLASPR
jgi:mono/diheme cytochrome c family protein